MRGAGFRNLALPYIAIRVKNVTLIILLNNTHYIFNN
ncbi:protein of unknown function [Escherichia coli]|nr:protein of unknown function [Escherichia coli]